MKFWLNLALFVIGFLAGCALFYMIVGERIVPCPAAPACPESECPNQDINDCVIKSYDGMIGGGGVDIGMFCSKNEPGGGLTWTVQDIFSNYPEEANTSSNPTSSERDRYDVSSLGNPSETVFRLYPTPEDDLLSSYDSKAAQRDWFIKNFLKSGANAGAGGSGGSVGASFDVAVSDEYQAAIMDADTDGSGTLSVAELATDPQAATMVAAIQQSICDQLPECNDPSTVEVQDVSR